MTEQKERVIRLYKRLAAASFLFGIIGVIDIITATLLGDAHFGVVGSILYELLGEFGLLITTAARVWIIWLILWCYFYNTERKLKLKWTT